MSSASSLRVLLVDDNADTCEALSALLTIFGHEPFSVQSGLKAVELAQPGRWDVALIDLGLPDLNGFEVARRIRLSNGEGIKLIAVLGQGPDAPEPAHEAGFDAFHTKPLEIEVIEGLLR